MNRAVIDRLTRTALWARGRSIVGSGMRHRIARYLSDRDLNRALAGQTANLNDIEAFIVRNVVPVRAPMVLISQVQRSGGTLLNQLLDGHPALAVYPHELRFGYDKANDRLAINPRLGVDENFRLLFDRKVLGFIKDGFTKGVRDPNRYRFFMVPRIQRAVFNACFESETPASQREVMDCFFTAFFNAWLDYQGPLEAKRWVTAFAPRFVHDPARAEAFFDCYPEGRLVQITRNPFSWYPSAKRHGRSLRKRATPENLRKIWIESADSMLRNKATYGDRVIILRFEDLVERTEQTMRQLCVALEIGYDPALMEPTFNCRAMRANSSFSVEQVGVISGPLEREKTLSASERSCIEKDCASVYERVLAETLPVSGRLAKAATRA